MLDVAIRNGQVVDGTGGPSQWVDVGIENGRVVALGKDVGAARRNLDAGERVVTPGFIDVHTHIDAQAFWDPMLTPSPLFGVTTAFAGNCGFSIAPLASSEADYLMRMLARVEGMPLSALEAGVPWDWTTTGEFLDRLDNSLGINTGFMVGHSAVRRWVMGEAANERTSTPDELQAMAELLRQGLTAGGMGFSTSWGRTANDANGDPVPSRFADAHEMVELARVCSQFEGTSLEHLMGAGNLPFTEDEFRLMTDMSIAAKSPLNWNVASVSESTMPIIETRLEVGRRAVEEGGRIVMLVLPLRLASRNTFRSGFVLDSIAGWEKPMALPVAEKLALLRDSEQRRRLGQLAEADPKAGRLADWGQKVVVETFAPENKQYEGRMIVDIASERGCSPFDALLDIVVSDELRTYFSVYSPEGSRRDWELTAQVVSDPRALIGGSDAGAHLDMIACQCYTIDAIKNFVYRHKVLSLETTIRLLSQAPAQLYGLRDRGTIEVGNHADVLIMNVDELDMTPWTARDDLPGGSERLWTEARGIDHVFVNGVEIADHGEFTGARPGTVLRSGRDTRNPPMNP